MEGVHTLKEWVNPEDWLAKVDLSICNPDPPVTSSVSTVLLPGEMLSVQVPSVGSLGSLPRP